MINRSLFEGMAVAHWAHVNPESAEERFAKAARLDAHLTAEAIRNTGWLPEEEASALFTLSNDELGELRDDFGSYGQWQWTGHKSLRPLVSDIEDQWATQEAKNLLWNFVRIPHRQSNQLLHSTVQGLHSAVKASHGEELTLWVGPSVALVGQALFGSFWIYAQMAGLLMDRFEMPERSALDELVEEGGSSFGDSPSTS